MSPSSRQQDALRHWDGRVSLASQLGVVCCLVLCSLGTLEVLTSSCGDVLDQGGERLASSHHEDGSRHCRRDRGRPVGQDELVAARDVM